MAACRRAVGSFVSGSLISGRLVFGSKNNNNNKKVEYCRLLAVKGLVHCRWCCSVGHKGAGPQGGVVIHICASNTPQHLLPRTHTHTRVKFHHDTILSTPLVTRGEELELSDPYWPRPQRWDATSTTACYLVDAAPPVASVDIRTRITGSTI